MVGATLCLVGYERLEQIRPQRWASFLLLSAGIVVMALFRSVVLTFVAALILTAIWQLARRRKWWRLGLAGLAIVALVLVVRYFDPQNDHFMKLSFDEQMLLSRITDQIPSTLHQMFAVNLPHLLLEATAEQVLGVDFGPAINLPLSILVLGSTVLFIRVRILWGLLVIIFIMQWSLILVVDRYFLPLMPLFVIVWWSIFLWFEQRLGARWGRIVFIWAMLLWFVPNSIRVVDFLNEQHQRPFIASFQEGKYLPYYATANWLRNNTPEDAVILADPRRCHEMIYLSHRLVLGYLYADAIAARHLYIIEPAHALIYEQLKGKGWHVSDQLGYIIASTSTQVWTIKPVLRSKAISNECPP
jgi:hypothetical protein